MTYISAGLLFAGVVEAHLLGIPITADLGAIARAVSGDVDIALGETVIAGTAAAGNLRGQIK